MHDRLDGEVLRQVMRRVPSPVAVVTARGRDEARGITIGSFTSVSLTPPLVSFNVGRDALMHPVITLAETFAVHLLADDQAALANRFARPDTPGSAQFEGLTFGEMPDGTPVLEDVPAVLLCRRYGVHPAGDHSIVVGEVVGVVHGEPASPLVYFDRSYRSVGEVVAPGGQAMPAKRVSSETP